MSVCTKYENIIEGGQFCIIYIHKNLKSEMISALIVKILNRSTWNFCIKKGVTLYLMLPIEDPTAK